MLDFRKVFSRVNRCAKVGLEDRLYLDNMNAPRGWGHARLYRDAWPMLQQYKPEDFVLATGEQDNVRKFARFAAFEQGMKLTWIGRVVERKAAGFSFDSH